LSSGTEGHTCVGLVDQDQEHPSLPHPTQQVALSLILKMKKDPYSEMLLLLRHVKKQGMDAVQNEETSNHFRRFLQRYYMILYQNFSI
jgi:hypothetical protein